MNKANQENVHYTTPGSWPTGVKQASEVAPILGISEDRLIQLAKEGCIPHWVVDGKTYLFHPKECKDWAAQNLASRCEGSKVPVHLKVTIEAPEILETPPQSIRNISNLRQIETKDYQPGVYFLVSKNEVVYVGQSVSPRSRIETHRHNKEFDQVYFLPVPVSALDDVESKLIYTLQPILNGGGNGRKYCAPKREVDINLEKCNQFISVGP